MSPQPMADVPIEELARLRGVHAMDSVDDLARPSSWECDAEFDDFLTDLYYSRRGRIIGQARPKEAS